MIYAKFYFIKFAISHKFAKFLKFYIQNTKISIIDYPKLVGHPYIAYINIIKLVMYHMNRYVIKQVNINMKKLDESIINKIDFKQ